MFKQSPHKHTTTTAPRHALNHPVVTSHRARRAWTHPRSRRYRITALWVAILLACGSGSALASESHGASNFLSHSGWDWNWRHHHHHGHPTPSPTSRPTHTARPTATPTHPRPSASTSTTHQAPTTPPASSTSRPNPPSTSDSSSTGGGAPAPGGYPTASNTGVPAGTQLTPSGSMTVTKAGTVIDGRDISGTLAINADNVTVENSRVVGTGFAIIRIKPGVTGAHIVNVEVNGRGTANEQNSMGIMGPAVVQRCNVYGVENGLTPDSGSVLQDNYVHDLAAPGSPHYDGIQIDGGIHDVTIEHNTVLNDHDQTSAVMIDNGFGPISNITVSGNRLGGGGYTVYSDGSFDGGSITGVSYVGNRLIKGYWGYDLLRDSSVTWTGNIDDASAKAISR